MLKESTRTPASADLAPPAIRHRLGERLVARGLITEQQLEQALEVQRRSKAFLGQIVVDLGFVSADVIGPLLAAEFGVPYVDLLSVRPDPEAVALLPEHAAREAQAIPIRIVGDVLEVAMADPLDVAAIDTIHLQTGKRIAPQLTMAWELQRTINDHFDAYQRASKPLQELETEPQAS